MRADLDASQQRVLEGPASRRLIVEAGPGSGKTTTSIAMIEWIAEASSAGDESILFVVFSRAAASAAMRAFESGGGFEDANVVVTTLDSLAGQLIEQQYDEGRAPRFDQIVRSAAAMLRAQYDGSLDDVSHLIVDEAQDLSADHRNLLCAIIERLPNQAGVTVFGDPLQSIYEFLDGDRSEGRSSWQELKRQLEGLNITTTLSLDGQFRARGRAPKKVMAAGSRMRSASALDRIDQLDELVSDLTPVSLSDLAIRSRSWTGTVAVLARTNADVLAIFDQLMGLGVQCAIRESAMNSRSTIAPWVAELWFETGGSAVTADAFRQFARTRDHVDEAWFRWLVYATGSHSSVAWRSIANLCGRTPDLDCPVIVRPYASVVVSTIHQAKGLEWDNVAVVDTRSLLRPVGRSEPESELLFVALSRARDKVVTVNWEGPVTRQRPGSEMLYKTAMPFHRAVAVQVLPRDLRTDYPVGGPDAQQTLRGWLGTPTRVGIQRMSSVSDWPLYRLCIGGVAVGVTTAEFGKAVAQVARTGSGLASLGPVWLEGLESRWSVEGDLEFWLHPRVFGFSHLDREGSGGSDG
ncbi:UvrD-helicase domain-containing protein [Smaragdicoccus niigatensis]|uniref:UvrD-helicase domain-containing protein n=1 Tax=Smaragdicoccus niigatensis TaxID=359359 RepID=UPI00035F3BCC|nr:UvrD-helicase domain-containing protein [Smaragdicoccus niigatensis]